VIDFISPGLAAQKISWSFPEHFSDPPAHRIDLSGYRIFNTVGVGLFGIDSDPNLPYMVASEWINIHEISLVEKEGTEQLQMLFDYKRGKYSMQGKVFLTTDFFLVTEGEFHVESSLGVEDVQIKIEYDNETYKVPLPKNRYKKEISDLTYRDKHFEGVLETEQTFDLKETEPESFKYFDLPGYGMPPLDFGVRPSGRIRYILMAVGILMIVFALGRMYWLYRKNRK